MIVSLNDLRRVEGVGLAFRLVEPVDAVYVHGLRTNAAYNAYLSSVTGTARDQRAWIESYKDRESKGLEYYYVIERLSDGVRCGVVRLYDIKGTRFTWGSWILDHNKPRKAALESAFLTYRIAFDLLELRKAEFDVRRDNENTLLFHHRFGAKETHIDEQNIYFSYSADQYNASKAYHFQVIKEAAKV